ncbi:MAG: ATP-dependent Clp protease adaptor ClpS [Candidatus Sericytochromatia bacterium]|nr:ATP-dependent Clp protease adaptor ClpS [Candidatus Sericytochromatia bacterium]
MKNEYDYEDDLALEEEIELKPPSMYKVIFHNDDYTSMEFVVFVLREIFHKSEIDSNKIMLEVHVKGTGIVGIYTHEVATTNVYLVEKLAEEYEYPFRASIEPV